MNLTIEQLRDLAARHGFPDPDVAAAVAMAESLGDPKATAIVTKPAPGNAPERSFGLWQINTLAHPAFQEVHLLDPDYNANAALAVSDNGKSWHPWSTYTSGAYRKFLPGAEVPPTASVAGDSLDSALDAFVLALIVASVAYAKRRKLSLPAL